MIENLARLALGMQHLSRSSRVRELLAQVMDYVRLIFFRDGTSLVTVRCLPFSSMVIFSLKVASMVVERLRRAFGRPRGLPEVPFVHEYLFGGLPHPIS